MVGLADVGFQHGSMNPEDRTGTRANSEAWRLRREQEKRNNEELYGADPPGDGPPRGGYSP